jgi:hypothetical protein
MEAAHAPGDDMDRRRVELQLRLIIAVVRAEGQRRNRRDLESLAERSSSLLDAVAIEIQSEADPELLALLARGRTAVEALSPTDQAGED